MKKAIFIQNLIFFTALKAIIIKKFSVEKNHDIDLILKLNCRNPLCSYQL